jgi:hypothetical protein
MWLIHHIWKDNCRSAVQGNRRGEFILVAAPQQLNFHLLQKVATSATCWPSSPSCGISGLWWRRSRGRSCSAARSGCKRQAWQSPSMPPHCQVRGRGVVSALVRLQECLLVVVLDLLRDKARANLLDSSRIASGSVQSVHCVVPLKQERRSLAQQLL